MTYLSNGYGKFAFKHISHGHICKIIFVAICAKAVDEAEESMAV